MVLVVPVVVIPLWLYGLHVGWWGCCGVGKGYWWEYAAIFTAAVVVATAALIGIAKVADRTQRGTAVVNVVASIAATAAIAIIVGVVE